MFGVTEVSIPRELQDTAKSDSRFQLGHSVMALITGFLPYFYVPVPRGFENSDINPFMNYLNVSTS